MRKWMSGLLTAALLVSICTGCGGSGADTAASTQAQGSSVPPAAEETPQAPAVQESQQEQETVSASELVSISALETAQELEIDCDEVLVVVHTNDVHGFIDVEPYVKAVADSYKQQYGDQNVITVSAGDVFAGGNAVAHLYNGETIPPIMDAAGYDMMTPGNNDFNLGGDQLLALGDMFQHTQVICADLYEQVKDENGETVLDEDGDPVPGERSIFPETMEWETAGGVKVGIFGLTTSGGKIGDYFASTSSVDGAQNAVSQLQADDCSVIIGVGHTGWNDDLVTPNANDIISAALVKEVSGIDAFVDGHTHSIIGDGEGWVCPETGTLVNQASCKGACVGVMTLYIKDGKVVDKDAKLIQEDALKADYTPDPQVQQLVDETWARLEADAGEMYLESDVYLNGDRTAESSDGRSVRTDETNLGDVVTDALRACAKTDVAMMPGFRLRASVQEGKIYSINLYDVFANGCDLYTFEVTGQELLEKMAKSLLDLPAESTQFNQISGASYGYVTTPEETADGGKIFTIVDPMVGGQPLELDKTYTLAMDAGGPDAPEDQEPLVSGMEAAAETVGEYLRSGEAVIYPDVPLPDNRIVPMDSAPADAVTYTVELEAMGPGGPA